jgi:hypothetical protein
MNYPSSDDSFARLHCSGWSVGEAAFLTSDGRIMWLVSGMNGENVVQAHGATQAEAWWRAVEQAQAVGMVRGLEPRHASRYLG